MIYNPIFWVRFVHFTVRTVNWHWLPYTIQLNKSSLIRLQRNTLSYHIQRNCSIHSNPINIPAFLFLTIKRYIVSRTIHISKLSLCVTLRYELKSYDTYTQFGMCQLFSMHKNRSFRRWLINLYNGSPFSWSHFFAI